MLAFLLFVATCGTADPPPAAPSPPPTERITRLGAEALRSRPRPSDPWSFLRDVPGIVLDRVDVGGSETAQQSLLVSRGDGGAGASLAGTDDQCASFGRLWQMGGHDLQRICSGQRCGKAVQQQLPCAIPVHVSTLCK